MLCNKNRQSKASTACWWNDPSMIIHKISGGVFWCIEPLEFYGIRWIWSDQRLPQKHVRSWRNPLKRSITSKVAMGHNGTVLHHAPQISRSNIWKQQSWNSLVDFSIGHLVQNIRQGGRFFFVTNGKMSSASIRWTRRSQDVSRCLKSQVVLIFHLFPGMSRAFFWVALGLNRQPSLFSLFRWTNMLMDHNDNNWRFKSHNGEWTLGMWLLEAPIEI